jgi:hypothetical protein
MNPEGRKNIFMTNQDAYKCEGSSPAGFWTVVEILMKYFRPAGNLK